MVAPVSGIGQSRSRFATIGMPPGIAGLLAESLLNALTVSCPASLRRVGAQARLENGRSLACPIRVSQANHPRPESVDILAEPVPRCPVTDTGSATQLADFC